jgi:hypothetical protein
MNGGGVKLLFLFLFVQAWTFPEDFVPPEVAEEDQLSNFVAEQDRCNACKAVAYQYHQAYLRVHKHSFQYLSDTDIIDVTESVCRLGTFSTYGMLYMPPNSSKRGPPKLYGPGMDDEIPQEDYSLVRSSKKVSLRLLTLCEAAVDLPDEYT